jgi:hypothetical protein
MYKLLLVVILVLAVTGAYADSQVYNFDSGVQSNGYYVFVPNTTNGSFNDDGPYITAPSTTLPPDQASTGMPGSWTYTYDSGTPTDTGAPQYDIYNQLKTWNTTFDVPKFNPSLGTLTGITLSWQGHILGAGDAQNSDDPRWGVPPFNSTGYGVDMYFSASLVLSGLPGGGTVTATPLEHETATLGDTTVNHYYDWNNTVSNTNPPDSQAGAVLSPDSAHFTFDTTTTATDDPLDLADWTGASGTVDLGVLSTDATTQVADGGNGDEGDSHYRYSNSSQGQLAVTYDYTPAAATPEPGSLALLGLSLPMAGLWFRRKRVS